ncbi:AsmA family protein [Paracraurococcus lichenis]|uniref:AsmA family protein n=1 Tax=Paracraurococcus lichenis TaxID=3064888 RepID=A0ABT9E552_9PROT|nr:AsmA family protein [Paracraurococcus sp. LOR1-02]MDO9711237.1 AsmA family protein [Paracraurococcus sp. LOR1-02]
MRFKRRNGAPPRGDGEGRGGAEPPGEDRHIPAQPAAPRAAAGTGHATPAPGGDLRGMRGAGPPPPGIPGPLPAEPAAGRRRRWLLPVALALLAALVAALWFVPRRLDWESWRPQLADLASTRLGRPVSLDGPITLTLLPQPRVEAEAVTIGPAEDGVTVAARAMRLRLDLPALLAGRLEPREIALVGGDITLPWPPLSLPGFRLSPWLGALDARLEDCRLRIGGLQAEAVNARLVTGGALEAVVAEGSLAWRGYAIRYSAQLGRAGFDGVAPLDLTLAAAGSSLSARGVLSPEGGFEGRVEASGSDLAALLPAPAGPYRITGRLTAAADLIAAEDLALDLNGQPARGAATFRLAPAPRLDVALNAGRLDLDAWLAALRGARGYALPQAVPVSIDLSAEATGFAGLPLRRLRGGFFLEGDRLSLSDLSAVLPGETAVQVDGATAGPRMELAVRFTARTLRETLAALGLPLAGTDPARLRVAEGRFKLALEGTEAAVSDLAATLDGARVTGAGVWRPAAAAGGRPSLGLGLTLDRLDLNGLLGPLPDAAGLAAALAGFDLNLRLAAERLAWRDLLAERATLDAALENGRLTLRRLALRTGETDLAASGALQLGPPLRLQDVSLELSGAGAALAPLLPAGWAGLAPLLAEPLTLRLSGSGAAEALALRLEGDLGALRAEATATLDAVQARGTGTLTLRHPGAARLLAPLLGPGAAGWLGPGSFSVIANLSGQGRMLTAEHLDLVAGGFRGRGQMTLAREGARPRLTGRFAAETLPLPLVPLRGTEPLGLDRLAALDAELAVEAARVEAAGSLVLEQAATALKLSAGTLRLEGLQARLGGGTLRGALAVEGIASPPNLSLEAEIADATLAGPLLDLPLDLGAGRLEGRARLTAAGHSPAALLATLAGEASVTVRDGVLVGLDLAALQAAAGLTDLRPAEAALRKALEGGATAFERLEGRLRLAEGRAAPEEMRLATEGHGDAVAGGAVDLARGTLDLRIGTRPVPEAPEIGLRLTGPAAAPRRLAELADFLRWRAEH